MKVYVLFIVASLTLCQAEPALAQPLPNRPYRAIFGGATTDPSVRQLLDLSVSVAEVYDDNALDDRFGMGPTSPVQTSGLYTSLTPELGYAWKGKHGSFDSSVGTDLRYYASEHDFMGTTYFGSVGFSVDTGKGGQLAGTQAFTYSPAYFFGLYPSLASVGSAELALDQPVGGDKAYFYESGATFKQALSRRSTATFLGTYRSVQFPDALLIPDVRSYGIGGRYGYELTKNATLHAGYVYRSGDYAYTPGSAPSVVHDIDVGVDYHRPLSFSRRTHLDFAVGSAVVTTRDFEGARNRRQLRVVGTGTLTHDIGRTWRAKASYNRGAGFAGGFAEPVFSDAAVGSIDGFLSRRIDFHAGGAVSYGYVGDSLAASNNFRSDTADARIRVAVSRAWAVWADYLYYRYDLDANVRTALGVPRRLNRNSVRVGLSTWLPLVRK